MAAAAVAFTVVSSQFTDEAVFALRLCLNRYKCKKRAFTKSSTKWKEDIGKKEIEKDLNKIKKYCTVVRVIAHTQVISNT
jgi:Ribosomal protein L3